MTQSSFSEARFERDCLTIADVEEALRTGFAVTTGGKSMMGCPVITFPDLTPDRATGAAQTGLSDPDYQRLVTYLTAVPTLHEIDLGFVLLLDRRRQKWADCRRDLHRIQSLFPAPVYLVLLLRPLALLQKALAEVANKVFSEQAQFNFKLIVCSSPDDVLPYISTLNVTPDLGGSLPYEHQEWIIQRAAVESFSSRTREMGVRLRHFTEALQAIDLPAVARQGNRHLEEQTFAYTALKADLTDASESGEALLRNLRHEGGANPQEQGEEGAEENTTAGAKDARRAVPPSAVANVTAVERLLLQLEETGRTFDAFWASHRKALQRHVARHQFGLDAERVKSTLSVLLAWYAATSDQDLGDSLDQTSDLLHEAQQKAAQAKDAVSDASSIRLRGCGLADVEDVSSMLESLEERVSREAERRVERLRAAKEARECVRQTNLWCSKGVSLLTAVQQHQTPKEVENQLTELEEFLQKGEAMGGLKKLRGAQVTPQLQAIVEQVLHRVDDIWTMCDKRRASLRGHRVDKRDKPVNRVLPELKVENTPHQIAVEPSRDADGRSRRDHVIKELLETEGLYVAELGSVLKGYKGAILDPSQQSCVPLALFGRGDDLFGNLEDIFAFHRDVFLRDLQGCPDDDTRIARCFLTRKDTMHHLYSVYCANRWRSVALLRETGETHPFLADCQRRLGHALPLSAYLLKPVQRITKYQLLLKDLLACSDVCPPELGQAVATMLTLLRSLNDHMHTNEIVSFPGVLSDLGRLLLQGPFSVSRDRKPLGPLRILKPARRHLFLYEKMILFTKRGTEADRSGCYHFKHAIKMSQLGLTESISEDKSRFQVWLEGRQEVYTLSATPSEREAWVGEIKRLLVNQFEYLRDETIKKHMQCSQYNKDLSDTNYVNKTTTGANFSRRRNWKKASTPPQPLVSPPTPVLHRAVRHTSSWESRTNENRSCLKTQKLPFQANANAHNNLQQKGSTTQSEFMKRRGSKGSSGLKSHGGSQDLKILCRHSSSELLLQNGPPDRPEDLEEDVESWSSDFSDVEDDEHMFEEEPLGIKFVVLADYDAVGPSEVSITEGNIVHLIKVGCAGWWYVQVQPDTLPGASFDIPSAPLEGWTPAAYLERFVKSRDKTSSLSSLEESERASCVSLGHPTPRSSISGKSFEDK